MPNKNFNSMHEKPGKGKGASTRAAGTAAAGREGTANWAGLPGKGGPSRDKKGTPKKGFSGPFYHKSEGV